MSIFHRRTYMLEGETPAGGTPTPPQPAGDPRVSALEAQVGALRAQNADLTKHLEDVKKEAIDRRQELKALKDSSDARDAKVRNTLVRAAIIEHATKAKAHDAETVARLVDVTDLPVDLEKLTVDSTKIGERIEAMRKDRPFLFAVEGAKPPDSKPPDSTPTPSPGKPPAGGTGGGTVGEQYDRLMAEGKTDEAAKIYRENRAVIGAHIQAKIRARAQ